MDYDEKAYGIVWTESSCDSDESADKPSICDEELIRKIPKYARVKTPTMPDDMDELFPHVRMARSLQYLLELQTYE